MRLRNNKAVIWLLVIMVLVRSITFVMNFFRFTDYSVTSVQVAVFQFRFEMKGAEMIHHALHH